MKNVFLLLMGVSILAVACSKDDDKDTTPDPDPPPQQITYMTNNSWKIDSMGYDMNSNNVIDPEEKLPLLDCQLDNTLTFKADSTGIFSEGASKCLSTDPQDTPLTWHFTDNTYSVINMDGLNTDLQGDVRVLSLTESSLVLAAPPGNQGSLIVALKE